MKQFNEWKIHIEFSAIFSKRKYLYYISTIFEEQIFHKELATHLLTLFLYTEEHKNFKIMPII